MGRVNWMEEHKNWILPSNMTRDEYDAWPTTDYRGKLGTIITVLHSPEAFWLGQIPGLYDERKATVRKALAPVQELLDQTPMPGGGEVTLDIEICGMSRTLWNLLGPKQRQWVAANCYVNVGFYPVDIVHDVSIAQPIGATLTLYDFLCERHSSEHALDHEPVELSRRKVNQLSLDTNIPVQNDMLFLPNRLMEFRNKVAVMSRAALIGSNPVAAYHRFLDASHTNFLKFEQSHSVGLRETYVTDSLMIINEDTADGANDMEVDFS
ncbi:MAG: hypothetical protein IPK53_11770 [bacterium]|nr:hypothetical protein [bacterium]